MAGVQEQIIVIEKPDLSTGNIVYTCSACPAIFKNKKSIAQHRRSAIHRPPIPCRFGCGKYIQDRKDQVKTHEDTCKLLTWTYKKRFACTKMVRRSLRQFTTKQRNCANCHTSCTGLLFTNALPKLFQGPVDSVEHYEEQECSPLDFGDTVIRSHSTVKNRANEDHDDEKPNLGDDLFTQGHGTASTINDKQETAQEEAEFSIHDALLKIFHFHWKYHKSLLRSTRKNRQKLIMCTSCAASLSQIYEGYEKFTKSTIQSNGQSYLFPIVFPKTSNRTEADDCLELTAGSPKGLPSRQERNSELLDITLPKRKHRQSSSLRRIKTTFKGDIKSLLSSRVKLSKLTRETAEELATINDFDSAILEQGTSLEPGGLEYHDILDKEEPTFVEDTNKINDEEYILSLVREDEDSYDGTGDPEFVPSDSETHFEVEEHKRKPGRPRTRIVAEKKSKRIKRSKIDQNVTDCHYCGKKLRTARLLVQHMRIYHKDSYDCTYCPERYGDQKQLKDHLNALHEDEKKESCPDPDCGKKFFTRLELKKHGAIHFNKKTLLCNLCNSTFPSEPHLKAHQLTHTESEGKLPVYICPVENCNKRYTRMQFLHNHVRYLHDRRNLFMCIYPGCEKSFGTESYLNAHVVSHESTGTHLCEHCGKNYKHKKDLRIHEKRFHSTLPKDDLKEYACTVCPRKYFRADHLRAHRVKANHYIGGQEPQIPDANLINAYVPDEFKCTTCNKRFVSDIALRAHELTHDDEDATEDRRFACSACDQKYTNVKALEYHTKYMHQLKNAFSCSFCPKSFGRLSSFKRHLTVHSNQQHICGSCQKRYKNKVDLMHHYRREHILSEKNYEHECADCDKRFYRRDMLRTHLVKTGHVAAKKPEVIEDPEDDGVDVYAMEESPGEAQEDEAVDEENEEGNYENEGELHLVQHMEAESSEPSDQTRVDPNTSEGITMEVVEITGEDADGTIAHVVLVDAQGIPQNVGTEVIRVMHTEGDEADTNSLTMYNYSIHLE